MSILDPIKCEKCGNADQGAMRSVTTPNITKRVERHGRQTVTLVGWRCDKCGHVTPDRVSGDEVLAACIHAGIWDKRRFKRDA